MLRFARLLGVALLTLGMSIAAGDAEAQEVTDDARMHFSAGVNLLRDPARPRYEEAYREFKTAYRLSPVTQILGNLGLCAMMLERDAEAIEAYEKYLKGMIDLDPKEREQIERDLATLKVGMVRVEVSSNVKGLTLVDRRLRAQADAITNVYGPIDGPAVLGLRQGHHIIRARAPGQQELEWEFDAVVGETPTHVFEFPEKVEPARREVTPVTLARAPEIERPIPRSFWYVAGATGVAAIAATITGVAALNTRSSFDEANRGTTPERADDLRTTGQVLNVTSDVLITATIIGAAASAFLYLTRPETIVSPRSSTAASAGPFLVW